MEGVGLRLGGGFFLSGCESQPNAFASFPSCHRSVTSLLRAAGTTVRHPRQARAALRVFLFSRFLWWMVGSSINGHLPVTVSLPTIQLCDAGR